MWPRKMKGEAEMTINMSQRAELHRILDNSIMLANMGYQVKLDLTDRELNLICGKNDDEKTIFVRTAFSNEMNYSDLLGTAELLEKEMGVEN